MGKRLRRPCANHWLAGAAAGWAVIVGGNALGGSIPLGAGQALVPPFSLDEAVFHHEGVLGTSMQLIVQPAYAADARECERAVLAEIDRLTGILSTYDGGSVISQFMAGSAIRSAELFELLNLYDVWNARTGSAIHVNMAGIKSLWKLAEANQRIPTRSELSDAFARPLSLNVDALGKAFIIDRAVEVARQIAPAGLLNIGGDIRAWGSQRWPVGIANPCEPADNMPPVAEFELHDAAVATSGGYARFFTIAGQRFSHIIDPRTLSPLPEIQRSATVVAPDCVTANALSTAACVLGEAEGRRLSNEFAYGHLMASASGISRGGRLAGMPPLPACSENAAEAPSNWPQGFQVAIEVNLKSPQGGRAKRPYVAVWIEDENDTLVRNIATWGNSDRYLPELSGWWKANNGNERLLRSVASATRAPGKYKVTWDGKDNFGQPMPKGTYHVIVEINREHGGHAREWASIVCADKTESSAVPETPESQESKVIYQAKGKP